MSSFYKNDIGIYTVPLLFYCPGDSLLKGINTNTIQQIDIMPSCLSYLNYQNNFVCLGNDIFNKNSKGEAITFRGGIYQLISGDYALQFDGSESIALYNISADRLLKNNIINKEIKIREVMETRIKAIIQQYNNRMINNQLHITNNKNINR